jgi:hypothetical protein
MAYANPVLPSQCQNGPMTCENGERMADCSCKCYPPWQGSTCGLCLRDSLVCSNGGVLDPASCTCACPSGYFGSTCESYVLATWTGAKPNGQLALRLSWSLPTERTGTARAQLCRSVRPSAQLEPRERARRYHGHTVVRRCPCFRPSWHRPFPQVRSSSE